MSRHHTIVHTPNVESLEVKERRGFTNKEDSHPLEHLDINSQGGNAKPV